MRADVGFKKVMSDYFETNNGSIKYNGNNYLFSQKKARVGFRCAHFDTSKVRSNFWTKPDYKLSQKNDDSNLIIFEHCGSWGNFYQKRFAYEKDRLALFEKKENMWGVYRNINIISVVYILPGGTPEDLWHSKRVIRATPMLGNELFRFDYHKYSCSCYKPNMVDYISNSINREDVIKEFDELSKNN